MPLYRRACTNNLSLHLIVMFALLPHVLYTYSLFSWVKENACKTTMMVPFCCRRCVYQSTRARNNAPEYLSSLIPPQVETLSQYNLRNAQDLRNTRTRTTQYYESFLPSTLRQWNNLQIETSVIRSTPLNAF